MSYDDSAAPYTPGTSTYNGPSDAQLPAAAPTRAPRRGPLSARLAARARATTPPAPTSQPVDDSAEAPASSDELSKAAATHHYFAGEASVASAGPVWEAFTAALREPDDVAEALRDTPSFASRWSSRADMLGACLDEYYRLTTKYNEARALLKETEQDISPLRQQQVSAHLAVRALEERMELHSRADLRAAYLGLAEIEMRVFRVEQERDLLSNHIETLEGFMGFLSRIISTVRTIPADLLEQPAQQTDVEPERAVSSSQEAPGADDASDDDTGAFEELVIDADEAAELAARGDVEVIGSVEEVNEASAQAQETAALPPTQRLERPAHDEVNETSTQGTAALPPTQRLERPAK